MELEQTTYRTLVNGSLTVHFLQESKTVNTMNQMHIRNDIFDFVGLQMTNKMPTDILGQMFVLGFQFLCPVLSEMALSQLISR